MALLVWVYLCVASAIDLTQILVLRDKLAAANGELLSMQILTKKCFVKVLFGVDVDFKYWLHLL